MIEISVTPYEQTPRPEEGIRRLPSGRKFARLKHDYEIYGLSRPTRIGAPVRAQGLPETIKAIYPIFVSMTKEWQYYWVDLFSLSRFNRLYRDLSTLQVSVINLAFRSVTAGYRAFTNRHGWDDGYADYINNINIKLSPPMAQETINCGGNIVELLSDKMRVGGKDAYKVRTLDARRAPPNPMVVNHITEPWLIFKAIISRRENYNSASGKWLIEDKAVPFEQLQGYDVPIPFACNDTFNYIEAERIKVLDDNAIVPSAYVR